MSGASATEQAAYLAHHPDLYTATADGRARIAIRDGAVSLASILVAPGLGVAVEADWAALSPLAG